MCHLRSRTESSSPDSYLCRLFPNYPNSVFLTQRDDPPPSASASVVNGSMPSTNTSWLSDVPLDVARMLAPLHQGGFPITLPSSSNDYSSDGSVAKGMSNMCPETFTGRVVVPPVSHPYYSSQAMKPQTYAHDVSLCNIMGMGADYLYVPFANQAYVLMDPMGIPMAIFLGLLVVIMMIVVGHNLQVKHAASDDANVLLRVGASDQHLTCRYRPCVCVCVCAHENAGGARRCGICILLLQILHPPSPPAAVHERGGGCGQIARSCCTFCRADGNLGSAEAKESAAACGLRRV